MTDGKPHAYLPPEEIAFRHNLELTLDEMHQEGVKVLLGPV
jgi:hypothetical protein